MAAPPLLFPLCRASQLCDGDHIGQRKAPVASKRMAGAVSDKKRDKSSHIFCPPLSRFVDLLFIY